MVEKAIEAAAELGRWEWLPDAIRTGGLFAARLAEQLGLRAIDVDLRKRELDVNGVWETPPSGKRAGQGKVRVGRRKPYPKNGKRRTTPYVGSMQEMYRRRVAIAFGMPEDTDTEVLAARVDEERERRAELTANGDWRDAEVPVAETRWLFPGEDGAPRPGSSSTTRGTSSATRSDRGRPSPAATCGTTPSCGGRPTCRRPTPTTPPAGRPSRTGRATTSAP